MIKKFPLAIFSFALISIDIVMKMTAVPVALNAISAIYFKII